MNKPNLLNVSLSSLRYFARSHIAIGLGVAAATAVIIGALVIGDSVRNSLRTLVLERLDNIECLLHSRTFFEPELVSSLQESHPACVLEPAIIFNSTSVEHRRDDSLTRASRVQLLAVGKTFWAAMSSNPLSAQPDGLSEDEVAINAALARELAVDVGDEITILVSDPTGIPSDNPLGKREDKSISVPRQKVVAIFPDQGFGGVSFSANQETSRNVFASLTTIQDILECGTQVNAGFALRQKTTEDGQQLCDNLNLKMQPRLEDYGLQLRHHQRVFPDESLGETSETEPEVIYDYFQLSSDQLILDDATRNAIQQQFGEGDSYRLLTYLINSIAKVPSLPAYLDGARRAGNFEARRNVDFRAGFLQPGTAIGGGNLFEPAENNEDLLSREVPYSIVVGVEDGSDLKLRRFGEVQQLEFKDLRVPYCWVNSWLAEQIDVKPGDWIRAKFFEPETIEGNEVEIAINFQVAGIVPLTEPEKEYTRSQPAIYKEAPTIYNDPNLTPMVKGITDQESMLSWDTPFELTYDIDPSTDDRYFKNHRLTPKFFFPYYHVTRFGMFASRFGRASAFRFPVRDRETASYEQELRQSIQNALLATRVDKGLIFQPIRRQQLQAASGTTPFDALFLSLSFFVIVAALMLVYLLFKLGIRARLSELGILQAQGFSPKKIRRLLLSEFSLVAALGAALGIALGLAYASGLIQMLETWWIGAISTRFLRFHASVTSVGLGTFIGFSICLLALYLGIKKACSQQPLANLRGIEKSGGSTTGRLKGVSLGASLVVVVAALALGFAANSQSGMAKAGSFFGSGMLLLVACIFASRFLLEPATRSKLSGSGWVLAQRAIARNPNRSLLTLGLLSVASFLIASMSVFQMSPTEKGYGGFNLIAQSSQPIFKNIGSGSVRSEQLGPEAQKLNGTTILTLRAKFGEDASCNNLFQVTQPTILGVPQRLAEMHDFAPDSVEFEWAATLTEENPWGALTQRGSGTEGDPIPVILDQNTAMWSLKQGASLKSKIKLTIDNQVVYFKTVGLLSNSVLQGKLLIAERHFERLFPQVSGYSFFMIHSNAAADTEQVMETLESGWANEGLDVQYSREVLAKFLGVQNTYIMAFQSLGALGLLLGTFGLISVQVRSVLERRQEFALMRAIGFSPARLSRMLAAETAMLLGGGLLIGIGCSMVALVPYFLEVGPQVSLVSPIVMLAAVILIGFVAALISIRAANQQSVLEGLRSE